MPLDPGKPLSIAAKASYVNKCKADAGQIHREDPQRAARLCASITWVLAHIVR